MYMEGEAMDMDVEGQKLVHIHMTESIWTSTSQHC